MRLATHNIYVRLSDAKASAAVAAVLERKPDVVGLQEWGRSRRAVLGQFGTVIAFPRLRRLWRRYPDAGYVFVYPVGGQPVGVDAAKWEVLLVRRRRLSAYRQGVRATYGTEVQIRRRDGGKTRGVLNFHLIAHHHRAANREAFEEGLRSVEAWVEEWHGFDCYLMGDFNKQAPAIEGMTSCCDGRPNVATFRGRPIDHIYGRDGFASVEVIDTPSDHHALIVDTKP